MKALKTMESSLQPNIEILHYEVCMKELKLQYKTVNFIRFPEGDCHT